ncbi:unnamed protein product [Anisakis simplex]|uniref:Williams-Beuren syndrome chromosomal region 16 protein (inferred by orthology to a human protein) n=1 Tax=Anisakis simplex TaxID=6269 RepID=A0A0M3KDP3_ANISI|nr:unnamed protein product [Anisakis simplex]
MLGRPLVDSLPELLLVPSKSLVRFASTNPSSSTPSDEKPAVKSTPRTKSVYGCGLVASGSLMNGSAVKNAFNSEAMELKKPTHITYCNSKAITAIASGFGFSVFASRTRLYGGGVNIFSNELKSDGFWSRGRRLMFNVSDQEASDTNGSDSGVDSDPAREKIIDIAAGRRHFLVATNKRLYAFGDNAHGQCGQNPEKTQFLLPNNPKSAGRIELPSDSRLKQVHCTLDSSFVLMESGEIFSFGLGTDGQLGRRVQPFDWHCKRVEGDLEGVKIVSLKGSTDTLMAVSERGELFMWGQNEYSQMKPFSAEMQEGFSRHIRLKISPIAYADSTATSCVALTKDGQVYVWGYGVLGQGPNISSTTRPTLLEANLFSGGPGDAGLVRRVFAGNTSMFAISEEDNLFAWGVNRFSHLGLGHSNNQYFPYQVVLSKRPVSVSAAPDHTLFLLQ